MGSLSRLTKFEKWDIYIANVRFDDAPKSKIRPVVILGESDGFVIEGLKMTSKLPRAITDYSLKKWKEAGLHKQTVVRISKKLALNHTEIIKRIGRLDPVDIYDIELLIEGQSTH